MIKRFLFRYYAVITLLLVVLLIIWLSRSAQGRDEVSLFITGVGASASFFYFIQKQQLEELQLFNQLFKDFNARYDQMNEDLNKIVSVQQDMPLKTEERDILNNYFNLCGEEYLFYSKGYIYPEVWQSWCNGMSDYLKNKRVRDKWNEEEKGNSYYGLTLDIIEKQRKQATT